MKRRKEGIQKNKYFLFWSRFFIEINALNAVIQLFYLKRGLNLSQILYLGIAWSVAALIFEIPTGYLADSIGRKNTIILGVVLNISAYLLMFLAYGFWQFAILTFLLSLSFSCFSGTDDAIIYDSLRELKDEKSLLRISGKYLSAARVSKIFTPFLGAIIAENLTNFRFNILLSINAFSSLAALATSIKLVEPNRFVDVAEKEISILRDSISLVKKEPVLTKIVMNKTLVFIGVLVFFKIYQPLLTGIGFKVFYLGVLYLIFQSILALIYWFSQKIKTKISSLSVFRSVPVLALIFVIYVFIGANKWLIYIATMGILILGSVRDSYFTEVIQSRLKSYNRATATSAFNFFKSVFDIPFLFVSGLIASDNTKNILLIPMMLFIGTILFFNISSRDLN